MRAQYVKDNFNMINEFAAFLAATASMLLAGSDTSSTQAIRGLLPCHAQIAVQATHTSRPFGIG